MKKVLSLAVLVAALVASLALAEGPEEATAQDASSEGTEQVDTPAGDAVLEGTEQLYAESEAAALEETEQLYAAAAAQGNGQALFKDQCLPAPGTDYPPIWASKNDPIVNPSPAMAHLHNFWGNKGVPVNPAVNTLPTLEIEETTCEKGDEDGGSANRKHNKSSYWMPQPYIDDEPLIPKGSGFYYSSKGGLDPTITRTTPKGLELIAKHREHPTMPGERTPDPEEAAEIDIACPAGELTLDQRVPDGRTVHACSKSARANAAST